MKKMTYDEFSHRLNEVAKARKIFIPHLTNNITEAFRLYEEILAEEQMEVSVSTGVADRPVTPFDDYIRPKCEECGLDMMLMINVPDINGKVWNTAWHCNGCLIDVYSDKTTEEWKQELEKADHAK